MSWKKHFHRHFNILVLGAGIVVLGALSWALVKTYGSEESRSPDSQSLVISEPPKQRHITTPEPVKAIYMTSWVAGTRDWRAELVGFVKKSEINSIVIDVKDYSGRIAFDTEDELIKSGGAEEPRIKDLKEFIETLHNEGIYAIARITVFQDPFYAKKHLDIAVQKKNGTLWKDRKGLSYVDPGASEYWDYIVAVARAAERAGFDELNFDYIRFPSDGNMADITFPISGKRDKVEILSEFFAYLNQKLSDLSTPTSADVFGMVTTNTDDLNIGQVLEEIAPHFDYIAPMVYPSHYPPKFNGYKNPAAHPYEIVLYSMSKAVERLAAPTSTPTKLRPWLQDFDLGATYDADKVRAQIKAVNDAGLRSWMIWDSSNKYTRGAYQQE